MSKHITEKTASVYYWNCKNLSRFYRPNIAFENIIIWNYIQDDKLMWFGQYNVAYADLYLWL